MTLLLANYLAGFQKRTTAVLEWNNHGDFQRFGSVCTGSSQTARLYKILGADYFPAADKETLLACMKGPYDILLFDYGRTEEGNIAEWIRCGKKLAMLSFSEWRLDAAVHLLREPHKPQEGWHYFAAFGSGEARIEAERRARIPILQVPYLPDAYAVTKETISLFAQMRL